jgi:hypothetical protein
MRTVVPGRGRGRLVSVVDRGCPVEGTQFAGRSGRVPVRHECRKPLIYSLLEVNRGLAGVLGTVVAKC